MIEFNNVREEDFRNNEKYVFCMGRETLLKERVNLNSVLNPDFGECSECLDVMIDHEGEKCIIHPEVQNEYNEFSVRDAIGDMKIEEGDTVTLLIRRMSSMITDEVKGNCSCTSFFVCDDELDKMLSRMLSVSGRLAALKVKARNVDEAIEGIMSKSIRKDESWRMVKAMEEIRNEL